MSRARILIINSHPENALGNSLRMMLQSSPRLSVCLQEGVESGEQTPCQRSLLGKSSAGMADLVFLILGADRSKQPNGLLKSVRAITDNAPIIAVNDGGTWDEILLMLKDGISDFVIPPLEAADIFPRLWRLLEGSSKRIVLLDSLRERIGLHQLIGESDAFIAEINKIPAVARCDANVLILGETGTGKEVCARAIHYLGLRTEKPFIPVNCAAIPLELVENELFGHERGAFSGASTNRFGLIREANGGTAPSPAPLVAPPQWQLSKTTVTEKILVRHLL